MNQHDELPLQIGETVRYNTCGMRVTASGVIIDKLREDYLRVRWSDMVVPTTHHRNNLTRAQPSPWHNRH